MEIYLDNAATTQPWPEVVQAVSVAMGSGFGNASSLHRRGLDAARRVADATAEIERMVGGGPWKTIITSGGCESATMAILGSSPRGKRNHIVTTSLEHAAVEKACRKAGEGGCRVTTVSAGLSGVLDPGAVIEGMTDQTVLVSVNHVAHELGTVQPVAEIARLAKIRAPRCRVHVDAVQGAAQLSRLNYPDKNEHVVRGPDPLIVGNPSQVIEKDRHLWD